MLALQLRVVVVLEAGMPRVGVRVKLGKVQSEELMNKLQVAIHAFVSFLKK